MKNYYLGIDIGASSGRHIVGWEETGEIRTEEVYRFPNGVKDTDGRLEWDIAALETNVIAGLRAAFEKYPQIRTLAIDTWGVDYVLMNGGKEVLPCYAYRDRRTERIIPEVHGKVPFEELYAKMGIQFQPFNTVYQLYEDLQSGRLESATDYLMLPEYLSYKLTGVKMHEYTNATTTGLVNAQTGEYDKAIVKKLGLPEKLFGKLKRAGTVVGKLKAEIAKEAGGQTEVVLCASHDTASAVEGIPMQGNCPYISSGTWSLLGLKVPKAKTDENSRNANYSNEGGVGYVRYQKNIMGMWVVNRLKSELCPNMPFDRIEAEARASGYRKTVDVNDFRFLAPDSMKSAFDSALGEDKPRSVGDYFRCAFASLAQSYKIALQDLSANGGVAFDTLCIVGGGAKNKLLNELTEQVCGIKVRALPIEATALGNLKQQILRGEANV